MNCRIFAALALFSIFGFNASSAKDLSQDSFDYSLVGVSRIDGVSYANLINTLTKEHILLSSEKSERELILTSVTPDSGSSVPSAIIQKDGESILLKLDSQATIISSNSGASTATFSMASKIPMPGSLAASTQSLNPPEGASLPLVFQPVNVKGLHLTENQQGILNRLRQNFVNAVSGDNQTVSGNNPGNASLATEPPKASSPTTATTSDAPQLQKWETAQAESDAQFKMLFGYQAFNQYQLALSHQQTP